MNEKYNFHNNLVGYCVALKFFSVTMEPRSRSRVLAEPTRGEKSKMHKHDDAKISGAKISDAKNSPAPTVPPTSYFILYFAEPTGRGGVMGPLKRARYATIPEAVERARQMKRAGDLTPIEIRDPKDGLITCELMGWRTPSLIAQQPVDYTARYKVAG